MHTVVSRHHTLTNSHLHTHHILTPYILCLFPDATEHAPRPIQPSPSQPEAETSRRYHPRTDVAAVTDYRCSSYTLSSLPPCYLPTALSFYLRARVLRLGISAQCRSLAGLETPAPQCQRRRPHGGFPSSLNRLRKNRSHAHTHHCRAALPARPKHSPSLCLVSTLTH